MIRFPIMSVDSIEEQDEEPDLDDSENLTGQVDYK